ncbi:MAG: molybdopterin-dependent oxidoreductase [Firmicutes bacterium]|nr:molybdopterin-dependent oxidoreductase [Bacillota bacterium]
MEYVGKSYPEFDAVEKVTGSALYTDDINLPNMLYGKILFSTVAHAKIISIDTSAAESLEGVEAVVTYLNSPKVKFNSAMISIDDDSPKTEMVFDSVVRFVGDKVAAVAAISLEIATKAISLIKVEYEILPAIYDMKEAINDNSYKIHPEGNLISDIIEEVGTSQSIINKDEMQVKSTIKTPKVHHGALETYLCTAFWSMDNKISVWTPNQGVFSTQLLLGKIFNLSFNKIQVIKPKIGGTFGGKRGVILEPIAVLLSKITKRPVRIRLDRKETIVSTSTRHATEINISSIVSKKGFIKSMEIEVFLDAGAYCSNTVTVLAGMCSKVFMIYNIPNIKFIGHNIYTNTPSGGAMRGYGAPQIFAAIETHMFKIARSININPILLYQNNLFKPYDINPLTNLSLGNCRIIDCINEGDRLFKMTNYKSDLNKNNENRYKIGYGFAVAAHGNGSVPFFPDIAGITIQILEDGSAVLSLGICDPGAGTYTILKQMASEILDISPELITIVESNTQNTPYDLGALASRNTWVGGNAIVETCNKLKNELITYAAEVLETIPANINLKDGKFINKNNESSYITRESLVHYIFINKHRKMLISNSYNSKTNVGSYGAHFAKVIVDTQTGEIKVVDYLAVCDVGRAINPMLLEGQIEGGIQMGLGYALSEEILIDKETGRVTNANLKKYKMPKAKDMPNIKIKLIEENEIGGPFGAKGIGEIATVPVAPAIVNAINDALGSELLDLPITSNKILKEIKNEYS